MDDLRQTPNRWSFEFAPRATEVRRVGRCRSDSATDPSDAGPLPFARTDSTSSAKAPETDFDSHPPPNGSMGREAPAAAFCLPHSRMPPSASQWPRFSLAADPRIVTGIRRAAVAVPYRFKSAIANRLLRRRSGPPLHASRWLRRRLSAGPTPPPRT